VRRRLTFAIVGVAAAAVLLFALPLAIVLQRSYRDEELLRLQRDTVAATREIDLGPGRGDPVELPRGGDRVAVYDLSGRRVAGDGGPARADGIVRDAIRSHRPEDAAPDDRLVAAVPLLRGERVTGVVRAERSDAEAAENTHRAWLVLLAIAAGVVALAAVAAAFLARRLAHPLERLAGDAERLGEGDFSAGTARSGVAELDAVGSALDATAARIEEMVSRERAFSADASHQLRTPLAALRIELEAIELRGDTSTELGAALAQVDRLQATVDTLLSVARDAPRAERSADLERVIGVVEERHHGPLAAEGRPLRTRVGARTAAASESVVTEILDVLVDNARRHGAGAVTVTVREAGDAVAIDVTDEGGGIAGDPEAVFARRNGPAGGHGIGLALARSLAHAEGGRLSVTRTTPSAVFTLWLAGDGA
jgi:signal transduction histidine kinase